MKETVLGYDIGGTKILALVGSTDGTVYSKVEKKTGNHLGREGLIGQLLQIGEEALRTSGNMGISKIGIICAGLIDQKNGTVITSPNVPSVNGVHLARILSDHFGAPAFLENDAAGAAIAEKVFGLAKKSANFIYLALSTGIGSGIFIDGKLYRGSNGLAGEVGHNVIQVDGPLCSCGRRGCLEAMASGSAVARYAREEFEVMRGSHARTELREGMDARAVLSLWANGNREAGVIVDRVIYYLSIGIVNICCAFDPELILIGGGMSNAGDSFIEKIREAVSDEFKTMRRQVKIARASPDVTSLAPLALIKYLSR